MAVINRAYPFSEYCIEKTPFTKEEAEAAKLFVALTRHKISIEEFRERFPKSSQEKIQAFLDEFEISNAKPNNGKLENVFLLGLTAALDFLPEPGKVARELLGEINGYPILQKLLDDDELEEIMVNGTDAIFVQHAKHGICKTNARFEKTKDLNELTEKLGFDAKREYADVVLPEGSRANIIVPPAVREPSITIRKFRRAPFTITDLIKHDTINVELAAYLWLAVEGLGLYPLNIMIAGGTATGKTTMLNALTAFIPPNERVVTVEDTPELNFHRQNWIQLVTTERLDLAGLVKNSLRMRPDRIIVGDIRGEEAFALFNAMNSGHRGAMGTLHANTDRDAIKRLENEPMRVPRALIPLADIVLIQEVIRDRRKGLIRRVTQVSEISRIEDEIALNPVFSWNVENDSIERSKYSSEAVNKLARVTRLSINEVRERMEERRKLVGYMVENGVVDQSEVDAFIAEYYKKTTWKEKEE